MSSLILKRASASRPSGQWSDDDYDVLEDGVVVGRISKEFGRAAGPSMGVGQRPLGGHSQARRARLRADARGRDAGSYLHLVMGFTPSDGLPAIHYSGPLRGAVSFPT